MSKTELYKRCTKCSGRKVIRGMGMVEKKCDECKGVGYLESDEIANKPSREKILKVEKTDKVIDLRKGKKHKAKKGD